MNVQKLINKLLTCSMDAEVFGQGDEEDFIVDRIEDNGSMVTLYPERKS